MGKSRKAANARAESRFVIASTPTGTVLGQVVKETATGTVTLRSIEGDLIEVESRSRLATCADPALFGRVEFRQEPADDPHAALESLIALFREDRKTVAERRAWAREHRSGELPDGRPVDELLKFRYEQYQSQWVAALRALLKAGLESGNERLILSTLDPSVPMDARRVAMDVAIKHRLVAAVPTLCGAAIHRTQTAFARDAVRGLSHLAPERLPLIARHAASDVTADIDHAAVGQFPEWRVLQQLTNDAALHEGVIAEDVAGANADILLDLLLGSSVRDQVTFLAAASAQPSSGKLLETLRSAAHRRFESIAGKESPTAYETALRAALAQLILSDTARDDPTLQASAARTFVRDADDSLLLDVVLTLGETVAVRIVRAALHHLRPQRVVRLLSTLVERRSSIAGAVSSTLRATLKAPDCEPEFRIPVLRLLASDPDSHDLVAREALRDLNRVSGTDAESLATSLVVNGIELDVARLHASARAGFVRALPSARPEYSARIVNKMCDTAPDAWAAIGEMQFPSAWAEQSPEWRAALLRWLPLSASGASTSMMEALGRALEIEGAQHWSHWSREAQSAALQVLSCAPPRQAVKVLAQIAAVANQEDDARRRVTAELAETLGRDPELLEVASESLSERAILACLLERGGALERKIAAQHKVHAENQHEAASKLSADLQRELERALHALGPDDQLTILFSRLQADVSSIAPRSADESDAEVAAYRAEFGDSKAIAGAKRNEALIAALRRLGSRSRSSQTALAFFRVEASRLLDAMSAREVEEFADQQRRLLDRMDVAAVELVALAFLKAGGDAGNVAALVGEDANRQSAINLAMLVWEQSSASAEEVLRAARVDLRQVAIAVGSRASEWRETEKQASSGSALAEVARRIAPTLEAVEGLLLNYMRVRRVLAAHALVPVEPVVGNVRDASELVAGSHRVLGLSISDGTYEVLTHGLRHASSGDVIVPAAVARTNDGVTR